MEDSFRDAMAAHARSREKPTSWTDWQKVAKQVAEHYDEAQEKRREDPQHYSAWLSLVRRTVNDVVYVADWKKKHFENSGLRAEKATVINGAGSVPGASAGVSVAVPALAPPSAAVGAGPLMASSATFR